MSFKPEMKVVYAVMQEVQTSDGMLQGMQVRLPLFTDRGLANARERQLNGETPEPPEPPESDGGRQTMTVRQVLNGVGLDVRFHVVPMELMITSHSDMASGDDISDLEKGGKDGAD